jgi:hypothetical protein
MELLFNLRRYKQAEESIARLIKQYNFFEKFMQKKPGYYIWEGNGIADNINWRMGKDSMYYYAESVALQALDSRYIEKIATVLDMVDVSKRFEGEIEIKRKQLDRY